MKTLVCVLVIFFCASTTQQRFEVSDVIFVPLRPRGLVIYLKDSPGIQHFGFHGNVNQEMKGKEEGTISIDVNRPTDGYWVAKDANVNLKVGDKINYWFFVQYNRLGFDKLEQTYTVTALRDSEQIPTATDPTACEPSVTKINGGQGTCKNTLLFEDTFSGANLDESKWQKEQFIPWAPDYEFVSYEKRPENCYLSQGNLVLKTTLRENPFVRILDLTDGCTGRNCTLIGATTIVPPAITGRLKSKFSFLYGKIEVRAKLPLGDWMFPELYLEPKNYEYGDGYSSGRIWLAYARGNRDLKTADINEQIGNTVLYSGAVLSKEEPVRSQYTVRVPASGVPWGSNFHIYTFTWSPDGFFFAVDGNDRGSISPPFSAADVPYANVWTSRMAPFDKEFVVSLGTGVGGISDFPDGSTSNGLAKPWRRANAKATLLFYNAKESWFPSWAGDDSALQVEYIKVWSL